MYPNVIQSESVLLITGLAPEDEGNYTCRAQSANTTEAEMIPPYQLIVSSATTPSPSPSPSPSSSPPSPTGAYYNIAKGAGIKHAVQIKILFK